MTDRTGMRPMTITLELSEPERGVYVAQAVSDDGDHVLVESAESPTRPPATRWRPPRPASTRPARS
jgi:hypothetical protein